MTALYYIVMFWMGQFVFVTLFLGVIFHPKPSQLLIFPPDRLSSSPFSQGSFPKSQTLNLRP